MALDSLGSAWRTKEESSLFLRSILWMVARFHWLLRMFGIDETVFRELLRTRVLISLREGETSRSASGLTGAVLGVLFSFLAGLLTGLMALLTDDTRTWIIASLTLLFFLQWMSQLTQFAGILVDPTDVRTLASHPVPDRTLFAARLAQMFAFTLLLSGGFTAGNMLLAVIKQPPLAVLFVYPLLALICSLVALGSVALGFALMLRIFGAAHFQRLTLWGQILGSAFLFGAFQIGPRLIHGSMSSLTPEEHPALMLWPPFQYAAAFELACGAWTRSNAFATLLALLTPLVALAATLMLASRYFSAGLDGTLDVGSRAKPAWNPGIGRRIGARLRLSREERAGFDYTLALSRREPHFLRGVLPQFASFQIMAIAMMLGARGDADFFIPMAAGFLALTLPNMLEFSQATPIPEARWIFLAAPLEREAALVSGGVKALFIGWWGGAALLLVVLQTLVLGPLRFPQILLAHELALCIGLVFARRFELGVPFTRMLRLGSSSVSNIGMIFLMGLGLAVLCGIHAALCLHPIALWSGIPVFAIVVLLLWRGLSTFSVAKERRLDREGPLTESRKSWSSGDNLT